MAKNRREKALTEKESFSKFKLTDSYTSFLFGAIVISIIGILFISFAKGNRSAQTSSVMDNQKAQLQKSQSTSSVYTIKPGDDLWSISEDVYKDGYKWAEIAKANKLEDPGIIHVGNKLVIPAQKKQDTVTQNKSITGNIYNVVKGDNLWDIAVRAYGDGFKWVNIAKANNLQSPDLIHSGNILKIPR